MYKNVEAEKSRPKNTRRKILAEKSLNRWYLKIQILKVLTNRPRTKMGM